MAAFSTCAVQGHSILANPSCQVVPCGTDLLVTRDELPPRCASEGRRNVTNNWLWIARRAGTGLLATANDTGRFRILGCTHRARRERRGTRNRFVVVIAFSKPDWRVITTALDLTIAELWRAGLDTVDIANALDVPEFEVANRLMRARRSDARFASRGRAGVKRSSARQPVAV